MDDTANYRKRGALIAARIIGAAKEGDVGGRIVTNQAYAVKQRWLQADERGDLSAEGRRWMLWTLRAAVATSGFADEAAANRDLETIKAAVEFLVNSATTEL